MLQRLLLAPTVERRRVNEETRERAMRPIAKASPEINMGSERGVVIPDTVVPQPAGFSRNIFLRAGLQECKVAANNGIVLAEDDSRINRMGQRPLRGLRTRPVPWIWI